MSAPPGAESLMDRVVANGGVGVVCGRKGAPRIFGSWLRDCETWAHKIAEGEPVLLIAGPPGECTRRKWTPQMEVWQTRVE